MKRFIGLMVCLALVALQQVGAEEKKGMVFFELTDSSTMVFSWGDIEEWWDDNRCINLKLKGDTTVTIAKAHIVSQDDKYHGTLPQFLSFKFNNKFNDQLYTDATGEIDSLQGTVKATVACIGKRLTPSFQLPDGANAYVNGKLQHSKKSRLRFEKPVRYTVAYPKQYIYKIEKIKDEVWSDPANKEDQWISKKMELKGEMFSTNAPSNNGEDPANMLDGDHTTIYHSTWGSGQYEKLTWFDGAYYGDGVSEWPYLQIELPKRLHQLQFEYTTRSSSNYAPLGFILSASRDGQTWEEIKTLEATKDNLPTTADATYMSPIIEWDVAYKHLRLQLTASQRKNYLVLSEFALYEVEENPNYQQEEPVLISPAEYLKGFVPYGRDYDVTVDFLTDHPTSEYNVPRVDIWFGDGESWSSSMWIGMNGKKTYEDATIKIDGAGVFPDMEETAMQIRGRGNSSWSGSYDSKNPYRMKFDEKVKPFGMTKGKSWVLLSNKQTNSMTSNAIAMKIADMVESRGCNHIIPVELYINNHYRGSYNFTEKVGFGNNSIDIPDESYAVMLELDSYYDEPYKFRDKTYNLYVNIKEPDFSDVSDVTMISFVQVRDAFNAFTEDAKNSPDYVNLDVDAFVRAMLVNDLVRNEELMHPKSWYLYNTDVTNPDSLWQFGPVWDFDWSFGYERGHNYFVGMAEEDLFSRMSSSNIGFPFFKQLLRGNERVKKAYYKLWTEFLESGKLDELIEYCDDYFQYASPSFEHNHDGVDYLYRTGWGDGKNYAATTENAKDWLTKRAKYIYERLDVYDISDDIIEPEEDDYGQPDRINVAEVMHRPVNVYTINGILVRKQVPYGQFNLGLAPGIYIVDGKKVAVR